MSLLKKYRITFIYILLLIVSFTINLGYYHDSNFWEVRGIFVRYSGLMALTLVSIAVIVSMRLSFIDKLFEGLDKAYRFHRDLGIASTISILAHYFIFGKVIKSIGISLSIARPLKKVQYTGFIPELILPMSQLAKDSALIIMYVLLFIVVISLVKILKYNLFKLLHKVIPILVLVMVFHSVVMMVKSNWYTNLTGLYTITLCIILIYFSILSLVQKIGYRKRYKANIINIKEVSPISFELIVKVPNILINKIRLGQFAFISIYNERHPFTIAKTDKENSLLYFAIRKSGNWTKKLAKETNYNTKVTIEGGYGYFLSNSKRLKNKQIWIAGGIGVTPFLSLINDDKSKIKNVDMYYCVRNEKELLYIDEIKEKIKNLENFNLYTVLQSKGESLNIDDLDLKSNNRFNHIYFCGPEVFREKIINKISEKGYPQDLFHFEYFDFIN